LKLTPPDLEELRLFPRLRPCLSVSIGPPAGVGGAA